MGRGKLRNIARASVRAGGMCREQLRKQGYHALVVELVHVDNRCHRHRLRMERCDAAAPNSLRRNHEDHERVKNVQNSTTHRRSPRLLILEWSCRTTANHYPKWK